jgi:hypothetical protein
MAGFPPTHSATPDRRLPPLTAHHWRRPGNALGAPVGQFAGYALISYRRIEEMTSPGTRALVLGEVIAYELGHLLLGHPPSLRLSSTWHSCSRAPVIKQE